MSIKVSLPSCKEEIVTVAPPPCGLTSDGQSGSLTISQPVSRKRVDRRTGRRINPCIVPAPRQRLSKKYDVFQLSLNCEGLVRQPFPWKELSACQPRAAVKGPELQERAQNYRKGPRAIGKGPELQERAQSYRKRPRAAGKGPKLQERAQSCRKGLLLPFGEWASGTCSGFVGTTRLSFT